MIKFWIDLGSALLLPTIAILGTIIAFQQSATNKKRYKHELFDRRYEIYRNISAFLANICIQGSVNYKETQEFLVSTRTTRFIFDSETAEYIKEIYNKAVQLERLDTSFKSLTISEEKKRNLDSQNIIKTWIQDELNNLENRFSKFMELKN